MSEPCKNRELEERGKQLRQGVPGLLDPLPDRPLDFESVGGPSLIHPELVIYNVGRPALFVENGQVPPVNGPPWKAWFDKHAATVAATSRSVGLIEVLGLNPAPGAATGFLIRPNVLLTCQHVLNVFTTGFPGSRKLRTGAQPFVNFQAEIGAQQPLIFPITHVLGEHKDYDAVLLRIGPGPAPSPLPLASEPWPASTQRTVFVVGHPAALPSQVEPIYHEIFPPPYGVKRVSPGLAGLLGGLLTLVVHDASTWEGNSGSAVVDFQTGKVLGLHFGGIFHVQNQAIPAWLLPDESFLGGSYPL